MTIVRFKNPHRCVVRHGCSAVHFPIVGIYMRLLVIEDYPPLEQSLTKVDSTRDGKEGLWYATGNEYDVIILDLMLPGMGGLDILKEIRRRGKKPHILILTAKDTVEDRVTGLDLGADDYLVKPFAFEELLARIRALLRRGYRLKNPNIKIKDLHEILLTPKEYALLEYLAVRAGETVSRTDIWEHLYEFNSAASSNVVDVYIGYLRKKVEYPGKPQLIRTVRGRGYLLGAKA